MSKPPPEDVPDTLSAMAAPVPATRYDVALATVPLSFVTAAVATFATDLAATGALVLPAVVGLLVIVDTCYLRPPLEWGDG